MPSVLDFLNSDPNFSMIVGLVTLVDEETEGGLGALLDSPGLGATLFAPTNAGLISAAQALGYPSGDEAGASRYLEAALNALGDDEPGPLLAKILGYHVVGSELLPGDLSDGAVIKTIIGLDITVSGSTIVDLDPDTPNAAFSAVNAVDNGAVIPIDQLLVPQDIEPDEAPSEESDLIIGTDQDDEVFLLAGDDVFSGGLGDDRAFGDKGDDLMFGGEGRDFFRGSLGEDYLVGNEGNDNLHGGDGDDMLDGGEDRDKLFGGRGDDTLLGGTGNDDLRGQTGDDDLFGGDGNDRLIAGAGDDTLTGGADEDFFEFLTSDDGQNVITDLVQGEDLIKISDLEDGEVISILFGQGDGDDARLVSSANAEWSVLVEDTELSEDDLLIV